MAERGVIFDRATAEKIIRAAKLVLAQPRDLRGKRLAKRERSRLVWVKVTGNCTGGGKYTGRYVYGGASAPDLTTDLVEADFGTVAAADNCYILNASEVGKSTHDLTEGTPVTKMFPGVFTGYAHSDGKPFIRISGYDWKECEE